MNAIGFFHDDAQKRVDQFFQLIDLVLKFLHSSLHFFRLLLLSLHVHPI